MGSAFLLVALAGWALFAFGGAYTWTTIPLLSGIAWLAVRERPRFARPPFLVVDAAVVASLVVLALQLIPLAPRLRMRLSPAAAAFDRTVRLDVPADPLAGPPRPLSLDPETTAWALALTIGIAVFYWSVRALFARGGIRLAARSIAWMGLLAAVLAILQHATAPTLLYWYWRPVSTAARPYGPFVNRNDLACWLVMAIPLSIGYLIARIQVHSRARRHGRTRGLETVLDATTVWLVASVCLMLAGLFVSLSRSGITAGAGALLAFAWLSRGRTLGSRGRGWLLVGIAAMVAVATAYVNVDALAARVGDAFTAGTGGRRAIWRETWAMVRDFPLTGVGAGAYVAGMLVYQASPREYFYFNHAHNEYLQILAEGGVLLSVPVAIGVVAAAGTVVRRLQEDGSAVYWMRAGAASGLLAVAIQSIWDTGVRLPANAVLMAILAAIAMHEPERRGQTRVGRWAWPVR